MRLLLRATVTGLAVALTATLTSTLVPNGTTPAHQQDHPSARVVEAAVEPCVLSAPQVNDATGQTTLREIPVLPGAYPSINSCVYMDPSRTLIVNILAVDYAGDTDSPLTPDELATSALDEDMYIASEVGHLVPSHYYDGSASVPAQFEASFDRPHQDHGTEVVYVHGHVTVALRIHFMSATCTCMYGDLDALSARFVHSSLIPRTNLRTISAYQQMISEINAWMAGHHGSSLTV